MTPANALPATPTPGATIPKPSVMLVLVVDSEPGTRQDIQRALQDFSVSLPDAEGEIRFRVAEADTGEQAFERMRDERPAILLLDHTLSGISRLEVLDQMARPFTPDELRSAIRKAALHLMLQRQARHQTTERHQVRYQFISILAHELKAPLYAIQTYLQFMRDRTAGNDPEAYDHMIDRSLIRVDGMEKLINDLLDLTRIESGNRIRALDPLDLRAVAADVIQGFAPAAARQNITVTLHPGKPVNLIADRTEIEIMLNNLISNAIKYNRDNGRVDVTLTADDASATLVVADTGIGMAPKDLPQLFTEFVRIKTPLTRNIQGSGLGLSIVKRLATLYNGDVTVHSAPEAGTTFTVILRK
ncbi:MAG: sensor histidine kinase [Kiritimatiellia bacterium]